MAHPRVCSGTFSFEENNMSNEQVIECTSLDDARNRAVRKLEELIGSSLGGYVKVVVAKNMGGNSPLAGNEVGTEYRTSTGWGRIRLDFDPTKGPHYNVETRSEAWAFCFRGSVLFLLPNVI